MPHGGPYEEDEMIILRGLRSLLSLVLTVAFVLPITTTARAELIATEAVIAATDGAEQAQTGGRSLVTRADVAAELSALGLPADEAERRVAALTDAEVRQIAGKLDELPAGGLSGFGIVVVVAIVAAALALTDYVGITNLFPWVDKREPAR